VQIVILQLKLLQEHYLQNRCLHQSRHPPCILSSLRHVLAGVEGRMSAFMRHYSNKKSHAKPFITFIIHSFFICSALASTSSLRLPTFAVILLFDGIGGSRGFR